jgi:hypothetical protein
MKECMKSTKKDLPAEGFVRIKQILAPLGPIPVSASTWWAGVRAGKYPQPNKFFGEGITCWDVDQIRCLINEAKLNNSNWESENERGIENE